MIKERILTVKLTGKVFDNTIDILRRHVKVYIDLADQGYKLVIIAGGGGTAREYIRKARELGVESNYWLDLIGIDASRLNALLLIAGLQSKAYPRVIEHVEEIPPALLGSDIVVLGGLIPGQSTAAVALEAAEAAGSKIVVDYTVVDRVYDRDPEKYPNAKPLEEVKASKLLELLTQRNLPGRYELIDKRALEIAIRSGITIFIVKYTDPERIYDVLKGGNPGTRIIPE